MKFFRRELTPRPAYRLIIPTTQLSILNRWDPELKVMQLFGKGTYSGQPRVESFEFGKTATKPITDVILDWNRGYMNGSVPIHEISEAIDEKYPDTDISIEILRYYHSWSETDYIWLRFERESIHPTVLEKMIVDGGIPKQQTLELLRTIKQKLKKVPEKVRKRWKPSYLILRETLPDRTWIYDPARLRPLMKHYMVSAVDTKKEWDIKDIELKRRGM